MARKSEKDKKIEALEAELSLYKNKEKFFNFSNFSFKKKIAVSSSIIILILVLGLAIAFLVMDSVSIPTISYTDYSYILSNLNQSEWNVNKQDRKELEKIIPSSFFNQIITTVDKDTLIINFYSPTAFIRLPLNLENGILLGELKGESFTGYFSESLNGRAKAIVLFSSDEKFTFERIN